MRTGPARGKHLHVVLDNLNIHKPKNDRWLRGHPNVQFHFFTPPPRLLAEPGRGLFLDPGGQVRVGGGLRLGDQLREHIDACIESHNRGAKLFA
jgi:hypothetical protein